MKTVPKLRTASDLMLNRIVNNDLDVLVEISGDEAFKKYLPELYTIIQENGWLHILKTFETYFKRGDGCLWGIRKEGILVGFTAIMDITTIPYIFYAAHPSFRRKGYMSEALNAVIQYLFSNTKCNTINTTVIVNNFQSIALLKSNGFQVSSIDADKTLNMQLVNNK